MGLNERDARRRLAGGSAEDPPPRPRALVVDDRIPVAARDAGSNAILSHMQSLQRLGYEVGFVPADLGTGTAGIGAAGIACYTMPWYDSVEAVFSRHRNAFALVYLHRVSNAARYSALARDYQPQARLVFSVADLHSLRLARQAKLEERPELSVLSQTVRAREVMAGWYADAVITHSSVEAALLKQAVAADKIHVVPWAVPVRPTSVPFDRRLGIAFIGGYQHPPNIDAARWLVETVMPEVARHDPTIPCLLVGSEIPDSLRALAGETVEAIGAVADLASVFDQIRLTVAPLAYGAGIKGKVLDSLAAGIPCVCTPAAAEGLDLPPILLEQVASTPAELAARIHELHQDQALNWRCASAGLAYIADHASEARVDMLMHRVTGRTVVPVDELPKNKAI